MEKFNLIKDDVLAIYMYGSRVYGCNMNGDYDLIIVTSKNDVYEQKQKDDIDITIYGENLFLEKIKEHEISVLECLFLPKENILYETRKFNLLIDLNILRNSVSKKSSNSFVKCKKKLIIESDYSPYIAKKSLFHSFRILMFGLQIARNGKIIDYSEANYLWEEIVNGETNNWEYYKKKYQNLYNQLRSEFRLYAPKE